MTGRRLYDQFTDAAASKPHYGGLSTLPHIGNTPTAWPFLASRDRAVWNDLARRITPAKRTKA